MRVHILQVLHLRHKERVYLRIRLYLKAHAPHNEDSDIAIWHLYLLHYFGQCAYVVYIIRHWIFIAAVLLGYHADPLAGALCLGYRFYRFIAGHRYGQHHIGEQNSIAQGYNREFQGQ